MPTHDARTSRETLRLETRARIFDVAVEQFAQVGMADADVGSIAAAAAHVARGTFYFHFPTKEHVLAELTRREERLARTALLTKYLQAFLRSVDTR